MGILKSQLIGLRDYIRGYKIYTALVSQTDTNAPTVTVLENTSGGVPSYSYGDIGSFFLNLTGAFPDSNKIGMFASTTGVDLIYDTPNDINILSTLNGVPANDILSKTFIEIKIYP